MDIGVPKRHHALKRQTLKVHTTLVRTTCLQTPKFVLLNYVAHTQWSSCTAATNFTGAAISRRTKEGEEKNRDAIRGSHEQPPITCPMGWFCMTQGNTCSPFSDCLVQVGQDLGSPWSTWPFRCTQTHIQVSTLE